METKLNEPLRNINFFEKKKEIHNFYLCDIYFKGFYFKNNKKRNVCYFLKDILISLNENKKITDSSMYVLYIKLQKLEKYKYIQANNIMLNIDIIKKMNFSKNVLSLTKVYLN